MLPKDRTSGRAENYKLTVHRADSKSNVS